MKIFRKSVCILILSWLLVFPLSASGKKERFEPMAKGNVRIQDGEFIKYGCYRGGEHVYDLYLVSKILQDDKLGNYVAVYHHAVRDADEEPLPGDYRQYAQFLSVSLDTASLIERWEDYEYRFREDNKQGRPYMKLSIEPGSDTLNFTEKITDGYDTKTRHSRVKIVPGYPVFDLSSLMFAGVRFLDIKSKGMIYIVVPQGVKEPIPCTLKFQGIENITTSAGEFRTLKANVTITDPFLGKLLESYTSGMRFWIEDSPRALIVRMEQPLGAETFVLEEISIFAE